MSALFVCPTSMYSVGLWKVLIIVTVGDYFLCERINPVEFVCRLVATCRCLLLLLLSLLVNRLRWCCVTVYLLSLLLLSSDVNTIGEGKQCEWVLFGVFVYCCIFGRILRCHVLRLLHPHPSPRPWLHRAQVTKRQRYRIHRRQQHHQQQR